MKTKQLQYQLVAKEKLEQKATTLYLLEVFCLIWDAAFF